MTTTSTGRRPSSAPEDQSLSATTLSDLLRTLDADGERELQSLLDEQRRRADGLLEQAHRDAAEIVSASVAAARHRGDDQADRLLAEVGAQARRRVDDATGTALDLVLRTAQQRLDELHGHPDGVRVTRRLLGEALRLLPDASRCHVPSGHAAAVADLAGGRKVHDDLHVLGAVVADDRGRTVDNTAPTRLTNAWPELRAVLVEGWRTP